jgi:hypothetical protein
MWGKVPTYPGYISCPAFAIGGDSSLRNCRTSVLSISNIIVLASWIQEWSKELPLLSANAMLIQPTPLAHHERNVRVYCSKFSSCCSISFTLKWGFFKPQNGSSSVRQFITFWPALEVDNSQCNGGPSPTTASSTIITVAAGSQVKAIWRHTLTSGSDDVVDPSHKVRVSHYPLNWQITDGAIFQGFSHGIHEESHRFDD